MARARLVLLAALAAAVVPLAACRSATAKGAPPPLVAMTFNLRFANPEDPFPWPRRLPAVLEVIRGASPDLLGTQEGLSGQIAGLVRALPDYGWVGRGRDEGGRGEYVALFYRLERFELLDSGHFWLSDTPDVEATATWGNQNRRMLTWARLHDRLADKRLLVMNTHFDHAVAQARERSAVLVSERSHSLGGDDPVVLLGDFNSVPGSTSSRTFASQGFSDAWDLASEKGPEVGTFQGWKEPDPRAPRIDRIFIRGFSAVARARAHDERPAQVWPSDHLAVSATLVY